MIGRAPFAEAVNKNGLLLDTLQFKERVRVEAATELEAARGAEIVLFCVKTTDTAETTRALAPLLAPNALVISLQNGVDNAEQIRAASGIDALGAVVYVAASVPQAGTVKHVGRGDLVDRPTQCSHRADRRPVRTRKRALPHLRQYRRRTLDQADLELRAQRHLCARPSKIRPDRRQRRRPQSGGSKLSMKFSL